MRRIGRFVLSAGGGLALIMGMYAGLIRLGWRFGAPSPFLVDAHGPLMVSGFLGTLISLERAAALKRPWAFLAPILTAAGAVTLVFAPASLIPRLLITAGSLCLVANFIFIVHLQRALHNVVMLIGVVTWLVGNIAWAQHRAVPAVVPFWIGFLLLTISGERLELSRMMSVRPILRTLFAAVLITFVAMALWTLSAPVEAGGGIVAFTRFGNAFVSAQWVIGTRIAGACAAAAGVWLLLFDMARRSVRVPGLSRFIAVALLIGYGWLIVTGLVWMITGPIVSGPIYDALLHTFFLGYVISMVFAHAPIIFPAVFETTGARYSPLLYGHLAILHGSLVLRIVGDLASLPLAREWGGMFNVVAILLFMPYHALARPAKKVKQAA